MIHFQFTTQYGKFVCMSIRTDKYEGASIESLMINNTCYTKKQIRTDQRHNALIAYAEKHGLELRRVPETIYQYE